MGVRVCLYVYVYEREREKIIHESDCGSNAKPNNLRSLCKVNWKYLPSEGFKGQRYNGLRSQTLKAERLLKDVELTFQN